MRLSFISEMLPNFCCIAAAVEQNRALLGRGMGQEEKKLYTPRSGCLLFRDASHVSPTAPHNSSEYSDFGERDVGSFRAVLAIGLFHPENFG